MIPSLTTTGFRVLEIPDLTITVGPPASGKSHWAHGRQASDPSLVLVNKDDIRAMLHAGVYSPAYEAQVSAVRDFAIGDALQRGLNVICHDTNIKLELREHLAELATRCGATFTIADFTEVPTEYCIRRDAERPGREHVGEEVIRRMAAQLEEQRGA